MKKLILILTLTLLGCTDNNDCECVLAVPPRQELPKPPEVITGIWVVCHAGLFLTLYSQEEQQTHLAHGDADQVCKPFLDEIFYSNDCSDDGKIITDQFNIQIRQVKCI